MPITSISNRFIYKQTINKFKNLLISFKASKDATFFTLKTSTDKEGVNHIFYTHVLLNYLVLIIREIFYTYNCGLRIYLMQGIERRNKESKNTAKQFIENRFKLSYLKMNQLFNLCFYIREYNS